MTKSVHISTVHPAFDQRIFHRECHSLAAAGYDTHLIVRAVNAPKIVDKIHIHAIENHSGKQPGINPLGRLKSIAQAGRLAKQIPADIYHIHDPELIPLALWLKKRTSAAVVFDCHENNTAYLQQKHYIKPFVREMLIRWMAWMERMAARHLDAIVTADQGVANLFLDSYGAHCVEVIHNFPRLELFPAIDDGPTENRPFDLVYHGTIPRYHLEIAFAVAEILQSRNHAARWLFFGRCPDIDWAQSEITRRGLQDCFQIDANVVPHDQVHELVRQAKIGFIPLPDLPKFQHNIPTKLFEFMALRMPVVLSDLPPSRVFVGDKPCAIMVTPDDYVAYADAIELLLTNPTQREAMGREGLNLVENEFNWQTESNKLVDLYQSLVV